MAISRLKGTAALALAALCLATFTGCGSNSTSTKTTQSAGAGANASSATASDPYPDWAAAVVPDYPNVLDQSSIAGRFYQIDTADDPATVLAWYKAHVSGGTWLPTDPDSPQNRWNAKTNGVDIHIEENTYPGSLPAAKRIKTMIALTQKK